MIIRKIYDINIADSRRRKYEEESDYPLNKPVNVAWGGGYLSLKDTNTETEVLKGKLTEENLVGVYIESDSS